MKAKSKWLAIFLVLGLVLAACGGDDGGSDEETTTTEGTTETTEEDMTTTTEGDMTSTTEGDMMDIATDVGVDLDAGTITIGYLTDQTGAFSPLVTQINAGIEAYWADVNANGGINGLEVVLDFADTAYNGEQHVQLFEERKDDVVAFGHSVGSPQTVSINPGLQEQGILAIPLTWYSGWSDPAYNSNVVPHGAPYCIEAMNSIEYMVDDSGIDSPTIAIASIPGDYGLDASAGAKLAAEALGLEIVYDGAGAIIPGDTTSYIEVGNAIAEADPDIVYHTGIPWLGWPEVYSQAVITNGLEALWSGAAPSWGPNYVAADSGIGDEITRDFYWAFPNQPWDGDSDGAANVRDLMTAAGAPPSDFYAEGFVESEILRQALERAYENGDMTQSGVLAAAKSLESVEFNGLAQTEQYVGEPNDIVQRTVHMMRPAPDAETGSMLVEADYTSPTAAAFEFTEACYQLGS
ncbi:MAG: ABC transporter substrate-binding protein [Acidimicrobiia bacterium]|jgi:ABC-type branched-subunit amino acid transport system substrate-binding protein